ncbi:MAG: pyruvate kinase [Patescibacteria group bacterium]
MTDLKSTKIVATIGPATQSEEILTQLINAGMNVARFNTKHADPDWHNERIRRVRNISKDLSVPIGILVDLQGPEIRIDLPNEKSFSIKQDEQIIFTSDINKKEEKIAHVPQEVIRCLSEDSLIILEDGLCEFIVTKIDEDSLVATAASDCKVVHRKTMNTPGTVLGMPSITDRDRSYLDKISPELIDFIGLSFVRDAKDVQNLKEELAKRNIKANIISKIENQSALDNINEIIDESDGIMIARGDLGVEVEYQQLVYWQKEIINKCRDAAKPVITATQMLHSMVNHPRPTRAEVSDVANAVYDGTDAVMLSEETTIGKYPIQAVKTQAEIVSYNEQHAFHDIQWPENTDSSLDITSNAANLLFHSSQKIDKIICFTETGRTVRLLSRFRPKQPIYTITHILDTYTKLTLTYGVKPYLIDFPDGKIEINDELITKFEQAGITKKGETVLFIHGTVWKKPGLTNTLALINT